MLTAAAIYIIHTRHVVTITYCDTPPLPRHCLSPLPRHYYDGAGVRLGVGSRLLFTLPLVTPPAVTTPAVAIEEALLLYAPLRHYHMPLLHIITFIRHYIYAIIFFITHYLMLLIIIVTFTMR